MGVEIALEGPQGKPSTELETVLTYAMEKLRSFHCQGVQEMHASALDLAIPVLIRRAPVSPLPEKRRRVAQRVSTPRPSDCWENLRIRIAR